MIETGSFVAGPTLLLNSDLIKKRLGVAALDRFVIHLKFTIFLIKHLTGS